MEKGGIDLKLNINALIGDESKFPLEHRIYNTILLLGTEICFICVVIKYFIDINLDVLLTLFSGIILLFLYYLSVVKRQFFIPMFIGILIFIFLIIPLIWIFSAGTLGATPYFLIVVSSMVAILLSGLRRNVIISLLIIVTIALIALEYKYPYLISGFSTNISRFIYISFGLIIAIFSNALLFVIVFNSYNKEHAKAREYLTQIEKQNKKLQQEIAERKQFEKEMARLDRLNLVGQMAAGIGHEIRNPMTTVRGFMQLLSSKREYMQDKEYFDLMIEELDRANSIITEFLSLAKNKTIELSKYNLNTIVKALLPLIQSDAIKTDKHFKVDLEEIPVLLLDEKEIRQIILNLVRNGLEAMPPGGKLVIKTYMEKEEVILSVKDEGKGIERDVLEKIGTPFFTTKDNGTGLGLAVCYSIAARHNAKIEIETGSKGTTFFVRFKKSNETI